MVCHRVKIDINPTTDRNYGAQYNGIHFLHLS